MEDETTRVRGRPVAPAHAPQERGHVKMPPRFHSPSPLQFLAWVVVLAVLVTALQGSGFDLGDLVDGVPHMGRLLGEMSPPSFARIDSIVRVMGETVSMAVAGASVGIVLSFGFAIAASRAQTLHRGLYYVSRALIALFRTVPDLVWAVFFVATVGLGPFAGMLTIVVDTIGFCGRFFAEAMEETDKGPQEALTAAGTSKLGIVFAAVLPAALPSFVNSGLFAFEKAVRSSVVLGLVGAGGIGIELKVAMDMFEYNQAATIILCIFVLVLLVEQVSMRIRQMIM